MAQKAITDKLTRLLVFLAAAAGLLYNALWYFPILMLACGIISVVYDFCWLNRPVRAVVSIPRTLRIKLTGRRKEPDVTGPDSSSPRTSNKSPPTKTTMSPRANPASPTLGVAHEDNNSNEAARTIPTSHRLTAISWPLYLTLCIPSFLDE